MVKGVFIALGIMLILPIIPIVHIVTPFGPFIGGYFGISAAASSDRSSAVNSLIFGALTGGIIFVLLTAVAVALVVITGLPQVLIWLVVVVSTLYIGSMSSLGAWYSQLRSAEKDSKNQAQSSAEADSQVEPQ
ncbi:MAG: hypothetical protein IIB30_02655 [Chloroflexi bacterium]|nr:hypothetical protein [Chloroflexota bacterium]